MALHFSANQYDKNFNPKLLQNWEVSHLHRERPRAFLGFTQIIANDRGHLLQGVKRSRESPWGTFMGTYDIPMRIPGNNMLNNTARTENATLRLQKLKTDGDIVLGGKLKRCKVPSPLPVKADIDADKTISPKAVPSETNLRRSLSGNGDRSGARNPEPKSSVAIAQSPGVTGKPRTPNLAWPRPASQGSRAASVRAKSASQQVLPPISASPKPASPKPATPGAVPKTPLKWPSPRATEEPMAA